MENSMPTWLHQGALAAALACCLLAAPAQAQQDAAVIKRATESPEMPEPMMATFMAGPLWPTQRIKRLRSIPKRIREGASTCAPC